MNLTRNDYRWFFIPTIQYSNFAVSVLDEQTREKKGDFNDVSLKAHFLCWTLNIYYKRIAV